jgi:hypothetical protein
MQYWKQVYKINFPKLNITFENNLHIGFSIDKDTTKESNKAKLEIYNLSDATRKKIEVPDTEVEIYAGYERAGGAVLAFKGTVTYGSTKDSGTDCVTTLDLADGTKAMRDSYCSLSYAPGTSAKTIIQRCANEMGVPVVYGDDVGELESYKNGFSYYGQADGALTEICNALGLSWSIQNNILNIILAGGTSTNRGLVFSPQSGLVGVPERIVQAEYKSNKSNPKKTQKQKAKKEKPRKKAGWKIETLLVPSVNPADMVKVESKWITGWFRVEKVSHRGDYNGTNWQSSMELIEVQNAKQDANQQ